VRAPLLLCCALSLAACAPAENAEPEPPPGHSAAILDDEGAILVLRGINVESAAKGAEDRLARVGEEDLHRIARSWGFNLVRLLIFWDALEPEAGRIDHAYLDKVAERVDAFWGEGVFVMLDMHQDVYAARFCCDGAPEWAIRDDGEPFELQPQWFTNYFQPAVQRSFDNFWDADGPHADLQEHFAAAWAAVARRFAGHPGVIGYDLFNEPHPGSLFDTVEAISRRSPADGGDSKVFDETLLAPFYRRLIHAIRAEDADSWIFFESRYGAPGNGSPCYIPALDDPREGGPRLVYAPHLYSVRLEANNLYADNDDTVAAWEEERKADAKRLATPILIGEWGLAAGADGSERFTAEILEMSDRLGMSWAYWSYDPNGPEGWGPWNRETGEDNPNADLLVRGYPRRVPGRDLSFSFDPDTSVLELSYRPEAGVSGPLELALPQRVYGDAWELEVLEGDAAEKGEWDVERRVLSVYGLGGSERVRVRVTRK